MPVKHGAPVRGILWDNDGVLVDSERHFYQANRDFFAPHGIQLSEQNFFDWFLLDNYGAWHLLAERGVTAVQIAALRTERNRQYSEHLRRRRPPEIAGIGALLARLTGQVAMGIVTSASREHFDLIHQDLGLLPHFQFVLTEESYTHSKPSPEPYLLGLQQLQMTAENCLVIEDSPRGLQAASAAGLRCIVLRGELTRHHDFTGAWRVVDDVAQLEAEIMDLLSPA